MPNSSHGMHFSLEVLHPVLLGEFCVLQKVEALYSKNVALWKCCLVHASLSTLSYAILVIKPLCCHNYFLKLYLSFVVPNREGASAF
uniref:Putative LRR receptor-like serine/threonine-protein kinase At4g08850 n=1 Tax=Rhizophora mucronata TaxID=61149 RepID=A0A2P2MX48_RHIMU